MRHHLAAPPGSTQVNAGTCSSEHPSLGAHPGLGHPGLELAAPSALVQLGW